MVGARVVVKECVKKEIWVIATGEKRVCKKEVRDGACGEKQVCREGEQCWSLWLLTSLKIGSLAFEHVWLLMSMKIRRLWFGSVLRNEREKQEHSVGEFIDKRE